MEAKLFAIGAGFFFVAALLLALFFGSAQYEPPEPYHVHADFAIFINGERLDFAQDKYMSTESNHLSEDVHFHDGNGKVIHFHAQDATLGEFLESLGFELGQECIKLDSGEEFCNSGERTLKMFVNKAASNEFGYFRPNDLDRILISFGSENADQLAEQMNLVSDEACIQSEKCPQRGAPSDESNCTASGGCSI
ncbi:MAG: hypothetical protein NUV67_01945, partial [archaeon]|nr:hypothetical protein [archaeon]